MQQRGCKDASHWKEEEVNRSNNHEIVCCMEGWAIRILSSLMQKSLKTSNAKGSRSVWWKIHLCSIPKRSFYMMGGIYVENRCCFSPETTMNIGDDKKKSSRPDRNNSHRDTMQLKATK